MNMFKKIVKYVTTGWSEGNLAIQLFAFGTIGAALFAHYWTHKPGYITISSDGGPPVASYFALIALASLIGLIYQLNILRKFLRHNDSGNNYKRTKTEDDEWVVIVETTEFIQMTENLGNILKCFYVFIWAGIVWLLLK